MTLLTPLTALASLLPTLTPATPAAPLPTLPQKVSAPSSATAYLLLLATAQDTRQSLSERYGVPPQSIRLDAALTQPPLTQPLAGRVVRVALPLTPSTGKLAPGIRQVTVRPGDTLSRLMSRYNLSESELISANLELASLDNLSAGSTLNIPTGTRGLLLTIKAGQDAAGLIEAYRASPLWTAKVNHFTLPTELHAGDQLLLPGIFAKNRHEELLERRQRAKVQAQQARILARYNAFMAWKAQRQRAREVQYQRYQAWLTSPQHLAEVAKYKRQAAYETWQAHEAKAQLKAQQEALALQELQAQQEAQAQQEMRTQMSALTAQDPRPQMQAAAQAEATAPTLHLSWPVDHPRLTSSFGEEDITFHQEVFHGGQDMAAAEGTPIYAAASGIITQSGNGAYGLNVYVQQDTTTYVYGHMSQTSVQAGQQVKQGDLLGYVGCTGMCTGPHLHFEVRLSGVAVDPMMFLPQDHSAKINTPAAPLSLASLQAAHARLSNARATTPTPKTLALKTLALKTPPLKNAAPAQASSPASNTDTAPAPTDTTAPNVLFMPPITQNAGQGATAQSATPAGTQ